MSKPYNFIYEKLVQGSGDLTGLVAYGIYKQEKIQFIEQYRAEGHEVTDEQIQDFHRSTTTSTRLESYRTHAENLLGGVVMNVLQQQAADLQGQYENTIATKTTEFSGAVTCLINRNAFWPNVWQNVVANLIAAIIVAFLVFAIIASRYGIGDTIADWAGYSPKKEQQSR